MKILLVADPQLQGNYDESPGLGFLTRWDADRYQWRIQDFPRGGAPTPKIAIIFHIFAENCMKMKEFGPQGRRASLAPPLDPPMGTIKQQIHLSDGTFTLHRSKSGSDVNWN